MERDYLDNLSLTSDLAILLLRTPRRDVPRLRRLLIGRRGLEVIVVSHGAGAAAAMPALVRRAPRERRDGVMVVDSGSPDSTPDMVEREFGGAAGPPRQRRLLGRQQPRPARERGARPFCSSTPTPRSARGPSTRASSDSRPTADRDGRLQAGDRPPASSTMPASDPSRPRSRRWPTSPGSAAATARSASARPVPGDRTSATTSPARSTPSTAPSCSCRPEAVHEVGLLDEGYWLYMEDLDWCRASGERAGRSSTSRRASRSTSRAVPAAAAGRARRSPSIEAWAASTAARRTRPTRSSTPRSTRVSGETRAQPRRSPRPSAGGLRRRSFVPPSRSPRRCGGRRSRPRRDPRAAGLPTLDRPCG